MAAMTNTHLKGRVTWDVNDVRRSALARKFLLILIPLNLTPPTHTCTSTQHPFPLPTACTFPFPFN